MRLEDYLKKESETQRSFAKRSGLDEATVSRLINKPYVCRLKTAKLIEHHTYGLVTWIDLNSIAMGEK